MDGSGSSSIYQAPDVYTGWKSGEGGYQKEAVVVGFGDDIKSVIQMPADVGQSIADLGWGLLKFSFWLLLIAVIVYLAIKFGPILLMRLSPRIGL